jgi:hypothetical protein
LGFGWTAAVSPIVTIVLLAFSIGPSSAQSIMLSGTATQGTGMSGATITAYAVNTADGSSGATLGNTTTDGSGAFALVLASAPDGPVRILATGGTFISVQMVRRSPHAI